MVCDSVAGFLIASKAGQTSMLSHIEGFLSTPGSSGIAASPRVEFGAPAAPGLSGVGGEECVKRLQQRLRLFLRKIMATIGDDDREDIVRKGSQLVFHHASACQCIGKCKHGHGQLSLRDAAPVLGNGYVDRPIIVETGLQCARCATQEFDVEIPRRSGKRFRTSGQRDDDPAEPEAEVRIVPVCAA